jgi:hypothetical protein
VTEPTPASTLAVQPSSDGANDVRLIELWLSLKVSPHARRAYAAEASRFLAFVRNPLGWTTLADVQAYRTELGQGSLRPASQNRALTALKSLLSLGHEIGICLSTSHTGQRDNAAGLPVYAKKDVAGTASFQVTNSGEVISRRSC